MENELRKEMIGKARENGEKHGKTAELDFGAGAEWMYEKLVKKLTIQNVSQQRELLEDYEMWKFKNWWRLFDTISCKVEAFLSSNGG